MYFAILENAWSSWIALQKILFIWYSSEKLLPTYIPNSFSKLLLSTMEIVIFTGTDWKGERIRWHLEAFSFKVLKRNHSNFFSVFIARLFMTSFSVGPYLQEVVSSAKLELQSSKNKYQRSMLNSRGPNIDLTVVHHKYCLNRYWTKNLLCFFLIYHWDNHRYASVLFNRIHKRLVLQWGDRER